MPRNIETIRIEPGHTWVSGDYGKGAMTFHNRTDDEYALIDLDHHSGTIVALNWRPVRNELNAAIIQLSDLKTTLCKDIREAVNLSRLDGVSVMFAGSLWLKKDTRQGTVKQRVFASGSPREISQVIGQELIDAEA